jgi:hypothetical protein
LSLLYSVSEVIVRPLTVAELNDFEIDLKARTHIALSEIRKDPPPAHPSVQNCSFCPVRHMCDDYWHTTVQEQIRAQKLEDQVANSQSKFIDLEILLIKRESLVDWQAQVIVSGEVAYHAPLYIQFSKNILPMLEAFEVGTHVRLLDVYFAFQQEEENLLPLVVAMTYMSEAFIVKSL